MYLQGLTILINLIHVTKSPCRYILFNSLYLLHIIMLKVPNIIDYQKHT